MKVVTYIHKGKVKTLSIDELRKMKVELTNAWESLCQNCGKCCFDKSLINGVWVINYDKPCEHLKFEKGRSSCDVYEDRFNRATCNTIPEAIQKSLLPRTCPYVTKSVGYKAPIDNGGWYKRVRSKMDRYDEEVPMVASTPSGGQMTFANPAEPPHKFTGAPTREDLAKPKEWKRRREALRRKMADNKALAEGKAGVCDPRQKTEYNIKPSGHLLGG